MKVVFTIARNDFRNFLREKKIIISGLLFLLLVIVSIIGGYQQFDKQNKERKEAQEAVRKSWLNQGDKNPHSAAHYGTYAFRPVSVLSFFDVGLNSYVGNSIYLEAHRQNNPKFSVASESSSLIRFGELTIAFILQIIMPLLIFFIGFNVVTKEKEGNTLKVLFSQGITMKSIAWGKLLAIFGIVSMLILPVFALIFFLGLMNVGQGDKILFLTSFSFLLLTYLVYLFILCSISVLISAISKTSRSALLVLLGFWITTCIILPKVAANLGSSIHKAPSGFEFRQNIAKDEENGIDGHNPSDKRFDRLKDSVLHKYNVKKIEELPINFDAIAMQEGERYSSMIYNKHFERLRQDYLIQNKISQYASLVDPFIGVRNFSMSLAGSDIASAFSFQEQAESYRFEMVKYLNNYLRDFSVTGEWDKKASSSIYSNIPDFHFTPISMNDRLKDNALSIVSLFMWAIICAFGLSSLKNKVN
jgi:ABC-2 type transport system permease protein